MKLFLLTLLFGLYAGAATVAQSGVMSKVNYQGPPMVITWADLASGDSGAAIEAGHAKNLSVQLSGTFTSTTIVFEGSNDGTTYYTLDDIEGTAISKTGAAFSEVRDRPRFVRPRSSVGGASTDVTATMYFSK